MNKDEGLKHYGAEGNPLRVVGIANIIAQLASVRNPQILTHDIGGVLLASLTADIPHDCFWRYF